MDEPLAAAGAAFVDVISGPTSATSGGREIHQRPGKAGKKGIGMTYRGAAVLLITVSLLGGRTAYAENANPGKAAFLKYCSACHGESGAGDGIVSGLMHPKPTNLTELAKQNGGTFPEARVRAIIDGRIPVTAHGESAMPVWGQVFTRENAATQSSAHVRSKVQLITEYLVTIQAH